MSPGGSAKIVAACVGLTGFSVALFAGLSVDNPLDVTLIRGLLSLVVCMIVGSLIGFAADVAMSGTIKKLTDGGAAVAVDGTKQAPNEAPASSTSAKQVTS